MPIRAAVRIEGFDPDGTAWEEVTTSEDASRGGASFALRHRVYVGQVILLHMALPPHLRLFDEHVPAYSVYGLIRALGPGKSGTLVRARFMGRKPPKDYASNPAMRYLMPEDKPPKGAKVDRRKNPRHDVFIELELVWSGPGGTKEERTFTENLSRWGARVPTSLPLSRGDKVEVREVSGPFNSKAEVANVYVGADNIPRLNLRFVEIPAPDHLLAGSG